MQVRSEAMMAAKVDKIFRGHQPHQLVPDCGFGKRNGL
jgi:hypothetical protein